jgi:putative transposase
VNNRKIKIIRTTSSRKILKYVRNNAHESRKEWMLELFLEAGSKNNRNKTFQFWRQDNQPKELLTEWFSMQKLDYVHHNPVEAGIVEKAEEYLYSSAKDYYEGKRIGLLEIEWL